MTVIEKKRYHKTKLAAAIIVLALIIVPIAVYIDATTPSYYKPGSIGLEVATDKPVYGIGEDVTFNIKVNNPQDWPVRQPNSIIAKVEGNGVHVDIERSGIIEFPLKAPTYPAHETTIHNKIWNQTSYGSNSLIISGNYTFTYSIQGFGYDISANCTFKIELIDSISNKFGVALRPDKPYFLQGENVTFTGTIMTQNQSLTYPFTRSTIVEKFEDSTQTIEKDPNNFYCTEHFTYGEDVPIYPANTNSTFTWTWSENKNGNQTVLHEPGRYILKYHVSGEHYSFSVSCNFEIKEG